LAFFFLRSLPATATWDVFRTSILNGTDKIEDLTFDAVSSRAASQVANSVSLSNTSSESALQTSLRCAHHGPGTHSTDDCIGSRGRSKQTARSRKGKETAKVAEEKDDDDGDQGSGDDDGDEHATHVYISEELKKQFRAYVSLPEPQRISKRQETLFDSACSAHM
ncbi:hypothetical protein DFP72DRAFT_759263, partial [Ephemerocybe angulata]